MSTITYYRPVGSAEIALLEEAGWKTFPPMPEGFGLWLYTQPNEDPRDWPAQLLDIDNFEYLEAGQDEVVRSWPVWGNRSDVAFVVSCEVDDRQYGRYDDHRADVALVNQALVGPVTIHARYPSPEGDPDNSLRSPT